MFVTLMFFFFDYVACIKEGRFLSVESQKEDLMNPLIIYSQNKKKSGYMPHIDIQIGYMPYIDIQID